MNISGGGHGDGVGKRDIRVGCHSDGWAAILARGHTGASQHVVGVIDEKAIDPKNLVVVQLEFIGGEKAPGGGAWVKPWFADAEDENIGGHIGSGDVAE